MKLKLSIAVVAAALALPAAAQTVQQSTTVNGGVATTITGDTGTGTVSASGIVANPQGDRVLLSQVISQLQATPSLQGSQIDVQVVGGRVTLNGATPGIAQAETAKSVAQGVAGSANVVSNLSTTRQ